jgi:flagellar assembly protein FliH
MMNMSSSQTQGPSAIQEFVYQNVFNADGTQDAPIDVSIFERESRSTSRPEARTPSISEIELKKREAAAFERGRTAARTEMQAEADRVTAALKETLAETLKAFEHEREQYYRRIEGEIVQLVLAVARKVLHREAQVDRVVLAGVVRVALEKISGASPVMLHVHPSAVHAWQEYMSSQNILGIVPEIVEDSSLRPDQLMLKTANGSTELGIDSQLLEIDKGFSDLIRQKRRSLQL